ncbi:serine/threonine-protein kinase [Actinocorallia populi]|uniref:serine/threonine-protein kinase n=1 Tax=Actinocorallia populi TaxID=2079200 RepID=UPI001E417032|nr:serine/threonine-protein kinase [Actinocorallia populi]
MPSAVGRYRIDRVLGQGAFASVWLGLDDDLNDQVAIKVLSGALLDDLDVRNRFLEEARILRRADSERLVRVHEFGELPDGRPYFAMSYADGGSLADRMTGDRPLAVNQALALIEDIAQGVEVINELGVIHRDLKPSNILFQTTKDGQGERLLIADLGLAKALAHASGAFTLPVGTPGYMSPEQARFGGGLDVRADVYGVGALSYHLLAGRAPGPAPVRVPPSGHNPEVPPAVDAVVLKALEADRENRWPTAAAYAEAIAGLRRGEEPVPVRRPEPAPQPSLLETSPDLQNFEPYARATTPDPDPDRTAAIPFPAADPEATYLDRGSLLGQRSDTPFQRPSAQPTGPPAPPSDRHRAPAAPPPPPAPGPSRSSRLLIPAVVGVGVLVIGAVAVVLVRLGGEDAGPVTPPGPPMAQVADASQKIKARVPQAWVPDDGERTWNPASNAGLDDSAPRPVLRATPDKDNFREADHTGPGLFVGLTTALDVPPARHADHSENCTKGEPRTREVGGLTATVTLWTRCKSGVPMITEVGLVDSARTYAAWVRIKQTGEPDLTDRILDGLELQAP